MSKVRAIALCLLTLNATVAFADYEYEPSDEAADRLSVTGAQQLLEAALSAGAKSIACFAVRAGRLERVTGRFAPIHYELAPLDRAEGPVLWFVHELAPRPKLRYASQGVVDSFRIDLGPARGEKEPVALECNVDGAPWELEGAKKVADALRRLQRESERAEGPAAEAAFADAVAQHRASQFALPEEVRRLRIQAEAAVREKRLDDAAGRYAEALRIAPWWPEGRYDRATVLAELGAYRSAVQEMRRYLALLPDAPDASLIRQQVRDWEQRIPRN